MAHMDTMTMMLAIEDYRDRLISEARSKTKKRLSPQERERRGRIMEVARYIVNMNDGCTMDFGTLPSHLQCRDNTPLYRKRDFED